MSRIRTRMARTIKTFERTISVGSRMKNAASRTKDGAAGSLNGGQQTAGQYAGDQFLNGAKSISRTVTSPIRHPVRTVKTVKGAAAAVKVAVKASIAAAKAAATGIKALVTAIAAGGWVVVLVVVLICLVAMLVGSSFGIFFSGENTGDSMTLQSAIQAINSEYEAKLESIKDSVEHDFVEQTGEPANWKDVLAIYAVKTTTDMTDPQEVVTMTEEKQRLLSSIFWDMTTIEYDTETDSTTQIIEVENEDGSVTEKEVQVNTTTLYISVSHYTAWEMASKYDFTADQQKQFAELLDEKNKGLWVTVLA